jgi:hypothetical protein
MSAWYERALKAIIVLLLAYFLLLSIYRYFDHDEFYFVHGAWYIYEGKAPYADFFAHHNPGLWYFPLIPILAVLGETSASVLVARLVMYLFVLGIAFLAYRLAASASKSKEAGLFAVLLLLTSTMFMVRAIEIRPDVPMVFLALFSTLSLCAYFEERRRFPLALAGLSISLAFLYSQKAAFLLLGMAAVFLAESPSRYKKLRAAFIDLLVYGAALAGPVLLVFLLFALRGILEDYVIINLMNVHWLWGFSPFIHRDAFRMNWFFWGAGAFAVSYVALCLQKPRIIRACAFLAIASFVTLFFVRLPYQQYFMPFIAFASPVLGFFVKHFIFDRFRVANALRLLLLVAVIAPPVWGNYQELAPYIFDWGTAREQLVTVDYVVQHTNASDIVYDGDVTVNLFRNDLHYFYFSTNQGNGLDTYRSVVSRYGFKDKHGAYDICDLIHQKNPAIITHQYVDTQSCNLSAYVPAPRPQLFVRQG